MTVPISGFTSSEIPCLNVEIGNKSFVAELDLGFTGCVAVESKLLQEIEEKSFVSTNSIYGWRGKEYREDVYKIPKIKIGKITFHDLFLNEQNPKFLADTTIQGHELSQAQGIVGLKLFKKSNLFLDLGHSKVLFCDSIETLKKRGYPMDSFVKVPFFLNHGIIEVNAMTPNGPLRCFLDTGFTLNVLNTEGGQGESVEQPTLNLERVSKISPFQIGGKDFGEIAFYYLEIRLPIATEAILGMEFFIKHQVFIDFAAGQIYFAPIGEFSEIQARAQ